ncbi:hypothetical protein BDR05DRAFT_884668, partial [Suillus weaverae]
KLAPKCYGPFTITAVQSLIIFTLQLPSRWKVHPMFYTSELSSYHKTEIHGLNFIEPPPDIIDNEEEYEVKAILSHKGMGK